MVQPSEKWLSQYNNTLVPETFVQITYHVSDDAAQTDAIATSSDTTIFSDTASITNLENTVSGKYATGETNLWILDGTFDVVPESGPYKSSGFVGEQLVPDSGVVSLSFSKVHDERIPGITILWSKTFNEYATSFVVEARKNGSTILSKRFDGNSSIECSVDFEISGYDAILIRVLEWCIPNRRARIEQVELGQRITFNKNDLLSYSHSSKRDPISGQLSKDSISFSVDNSDQKWNPINPSGLYKYLYERQAVYVNYGMDIDGEIEWINGGKFYLSGWSVPANGITASFEARDALAFLIDSVYTGRKSGTLYEMCYDALELLNVSGITFSINESLKNYNADFSGETTSYKNADVLQLSANAAGMALYQTRDGVICIDSALSSPIDESKTYEISEMNNFRYPEITFSNRLKNISYSINGATALYPNGAKGDGVTQSVSNPFLSSSILEQPKNVLTESYRILSNRRKATLSYRASPHIDALDFVKLNHQFGYSSNLLITDVSYTFNGCFKGSVSGYMVEDVDSLNLDISEVFLFPNDTATITATLAPSSTDSPVIIWNAEPSGIVDLDVTKNESGVSVCKISYLHRGSATITASVSGVSASCSVNTYANAVSSLAEGSEVLIPENGQYVSFIIAKHNYESDINKLGGTLFVRSDMITGQKWNEKSVNAYSGSTIDKYLNANYKNALSSFIQKSIMNWNIYYTPGNGNKTMTTLSRSVFLLSAKEIVYNELTGGQVWGKGCNGEGKLLPTALKLFKDNLSTEGTGSFQKNVWTRTPVYDSSYFGFDGHNTDSAVACWAYKDDDRIHYTTFPVTRDTSYSPLDSSYGFQPAFVLPATLMVGKDNKIEE